MRISPLLLALPALSAAQQVPFLDQVKAWFGKATDSLSSALPSASTLSIPNPVASAAKKVASLKVERLTLANHKQILQPGAATAHPGIEEWMIFVTGGNKTCYGLCRHAEIAWNESVALISASRSPPNLAMLNCETDGVLCNTWMVDRPALIHMLLPQPAADQSTPSTTVRYIHVNRTSVTAPDIAAVHLKEKYKETEPYDGVFHPFDGPLARFGLNVPVGYLVWGLGKIPSWAFMVGISFLSTLR